MTKYFECALLPVHVVISSVLCALMVWSNSTFNLRAVVSSHGFSNFCQIIGTIPEFADSSGSDPQQCFAAVEQFTYDWIFYVFNVAYPTRACSFIGTNGNDAKTDHWDATNSDSTVAFYATNDVTIGFSMQCIHVFHVFFSTWCGKFVYSAAHICPISIGIVGDLVWSFSWTTWKQSGTLGAVCCSTSWSGTFSAYSKWSGTQTSSSRSPTRPSSWATECYKLSFRFRAMVFTIMWSNLEQVILLNEFGLQLVSEWYHQSAMRLSVLPLDGLRLMILFRPVMKSKKWSTLNWRHKDFNFGSLFQWRHFHLNY